MDDKLRLWNRLEKRIVSLAKVECGFITAVSFTPDASIALVGSYDGRLLIYDAKVLFLYLSINSIKIFLFIL